MDNKHLKLILDSEKKYRQKTTQYESIDISLFKNQLKKLGYNVTITNYFDVINKIDEVKNKIIIYTSNQRISYKKYIEDIMYQLKDSNVLIPQYNSLLGHENKCFQELERKKLKIDDLKSWVISDIKELNKIKIKYPIVIKAPDTSGSQGVFLAYNKKELFKIINNNFRKRDFRFCSLIFKKYLRRFISNATYSWVLFRFDDYNYSRFILQEYISNLDGDFKILIYGNKYYSLKRGVKKGDWKASGSGIHDYKIDPPEEVLNFAKQCFEKLKVPFAGFDIAIDKNKKCYLLEYQSIHIGPVTLINSEKYFVYEKNKWSTVKEPSRLELEYANAIDWYIKKYI